MDARGNPAESRHTTSSDIDLVRVDEAVLALMHLTLHDRCEGTARAWKGFDWGVLARLHEQGLICDPAGKTKSVVLTQEGMRRCQALFQGMFARVDGTVVQGSRSWGGFEDARPLPATPFSEADPLVAELAAHYWISFRAFHCLLAAPYRFRALADLADDVAGRLRFSHIVPLPANELLAIPNLSRNVCREIALAVDRLGWRAQVHPEHPLLPEAFDMTDAWIAQHDRISAQRREARRARFRYPSDEGGREIVGRGDRAAPRRVALAGRHAREASA